MRLRVEFNKLRCVNNQKCIEESPTYFLPTPGKPNLKGSTMQAGKFVLEKDFAQEEVNEIVNAARACPVNAIGVTDAKTGKPVVRTEVSVEKVEEIEAKYDDAKEFEIDPKGYFLIRVNEDKQCIEVAFCKKLNKVAVVVRGKKPIEI